MPGLRRGGRHRLDANHKTVVQAINQIAGLGFLDLSQSDLGIDGLVVGNGRIVPVEIKDPKSSRGLELSESEQRRHQWFSRFGITVEILTGDDDSLNVFRPRARDFYAVERNK